jgi:hypothetical protein
MNPHPMSTEWNLENWRQSLGALLKSARDTEAKAKGEMLNTKTTSAFSLEPLALFL